jgi:hypothetical protein
VQKEKQTKKSEFEFWKKFTTTFQTPQLSFFFRFLSKSLPQSSAYIKINFVPILSILTTKTSPKICKKTIFSYNKGNLAYETQR